METEIVCNSNLPARKKRTGYVYLFSAAGGFFKIGASKDPDERLSAFASLPFDVKMAHTIKTDDASWLEAFYHHVFADKHVVGEWFRLTAEDVEALKLHSERQSPICSIKVIARPKPIVEKTVERVLRAPVVISENFAQRLRGIRVNAGLSQNELAEKSGVNLRTLQGWEGGKTTDLERICSLLSALGYDLRPLSTTIPPQPKRPRGRPRKE